MQRHDNRSSDIPSGGNSDHGDVQITDSHNADYSEGNRNERNKYIINTHKTTTAIATQELFPKKFSDEKDDTQNHGNNIRNQANQQLCLQFVTTEGGGSITVLMVIGSTTMVLGSSVLLVFEFIVFY